MIIIPGPMIRDLWLESILLWSLTQVILGHNTVTMLDKVSGAYGVQSDVGNVG